MSIVDNRWEILKFVASNLAVQVSEVIKNFPGRERSELVAHLSELEKLGLVRVRSSAGTESGEDAIFSITADGSKKADALRTRAAASAVASLVGGRI